MHTIQQNNNNLKKKHFTLNIPILKSTFSHPFTGWFSPAPVLCSGKSCALWLASLSSLFLFLSFSFSLYHFWLPHGMEFPGQLSCCNARLPRCWARIEPSSQCSRDASHSVASQWERLSLSYSNFSIFFQTKYTNKTKHVSIDFFFPAELLNSFLGRGTH